MTEIYHFKVVHADAELTNYGTRVRLFYPQQLKPIDRRLNEELDFGVQTLQKIIGEGYAEIADELHPIKPSSAGSLYIFSDGKFICHRRDKFAPTHKMYHSAYGGYTKSKEFIYSAEGLIETALRESAEECLLITNEKQPRLIVPLDSKEYTLQRAQALDLYIKPHFIDVSTIKGSDELEVYDHNRNIIFKTNTHIEFIWESQTSLNSLFLRKFPLHSDEILPIDAEGIIKDNIFQHFNRESYKIDPVVIANQPFGSILSDPKVYQTQFDNGQPKIYTPKYRAPFLGPDNIKVVHPHIWAPEDLICRTLCALGVPGYENWMKIELSKELTKMRKLREGTWEQQGLLENSVHLK